MFLIRFGSEFRLQDILAGIAGDGTWRCVDVGTTVRLFTRVLPCLAWSGSEYLSLWWWICCLLLSFLIASQNHPKYIFLAVVIGIHSFNIRISGAPKIERKVQSVRWWMAHYGSPTPKRHYAFGNSAVILGLDRGVLRKWRPKGKKVTTCQHYLDKQGVKRYKGTSKLRSTEQLTRNLQWSD